MALFHGQLPIYTVDSFSDKPFGGNPAAVCLDHTEEGLSSTQMLQIANEMNLSDTAFVRRLSNDDNFESASHFALRWFTPTQEVVLCGHATLATAAVLFKCVKNKSEALSFDTLSGTLIARNSEAGITIDFPLDPPQPLQEKDKMAFSAVVKTMVSPDVVEDILFAPRNKFLLVQLKQGSLTRKNLEELPVQTNKLKAAYTADDLMAVVVTIRSTPGGDFVDDRNSPYDFVSRMFAPWLGISEDPVTGAAHTIMSAHWSKILNKKTLYARQCSKRGGNVRMKVKGDDGRVDITGEAAIVLIGHINI